VGVSSGGCPFTIHLLNLNLFSALLQSAAPWSRSCAASTLGPACCPPPRHRCRAELVAGQTGREGDWEREGEV